MYDGAFDIHKQIELDRTEQGLNATKLRKIRDYVKGKQDITLTEQQVKMLKGVHGNEYCDNIFKQILAEHSDRLELKEVRALEGTPEDEFCKDLWAKNNIDAMQSKTHRRTLRDGDYCLMPVWDTQKQRVVIHRELWWDGDKGVFVAYDAQGNVLYAVKEWPVAGGRRRVVWFEGYIARYFSVGGMVWEPYFLSSDAPNIWPIPYSREDGKPMHIPLVHFRNDGDEFENYGESLFIGGKMGGQDQINDTQWDITACSRMTGYQQTTSKGFELDKDRNNKDIPPEVGPGVHHHSESPDAEWGVLPAGDITTLESTYYLKVKSLCRQTRTPDHTILGQWPSGEALYRAEMPIVKATQNRIKLLKNAWVEVFHRAMELANVYGRAGLNEDILLEAVYNEPDDRDPVTIAMADQSFWQAATYAVQAGCPLATFLRKQGWSDDDIKQLAKDQDEDMKRRLADIAATEEITGGNDQQNQQSQD